MTEEKGPEQFVPTKNDLKTFVPSTDDTLKAAEPASGAEEPVAPTERSADEIIAEQIKEAKAAGKEYQGKDFRDKVVEK